tara:strand:- start:4193 stop:5149 length:957 start_codon:yes stop_codon:yes gene_type:complete
MSVYTLDIDSSERDPVSYPNPGDYVVELRHPIYDVKKLSIVSARIHASQLLINDNNNTFSVNGKTISLPNENYSGNEIATELLSKFQAANIDPVGSVPISSVTYDKSKNDLTFGGTGAFTFEFYGGENGYHTDVAVDGKTTPHDILGLSASNVTSVNNTLTTGSINLQGPDALILKISSGAEELNKTVYSDTPFYTGRILMCGDVINYSGSDDAVEHNFDTGAQNISKLRIQFFYSSNNRLIPYNFRNANHILKLNIECSTDKLQNVPKVDKKFELPPPIRIPSIEDPSRWNGMIYIFAIIAAGIFFIFVAKPKKLSE